MSNVEICQVAYEGRMNRLKALLESNPKLISVADQNCRQPIHWACSGGHRDIVQFLLNCSLAIEGMFDINTPDDAQSTPLHISTSSGHLHIVILLIQTGYCDVNSVNNQEQTALFFAATKNWIEIAEVLLSAGSDPNIATSTRCTPMHKASSKSEHGHQILQLLLDAGGNKDPKDNDHNTPLHIACENNNIRCIQLLVDRGAKLHCVNKAGKTPFELCTQRIRDMLPTN